MKRSLNFVLLVLAAAVVTSCASGPKFTELKPDMAANSPEMGRIFFYRTTAFGALLKPDVLLNGEKVGEATAQGFFYVDRPAGDFTAATSTEVTRKVSFTLDKGQARFIRFKVSMGFFAGHVYGELVDEAEAKEEIKDCKYTGDQAKKTDTK
jgi:Protein of unknown function (DUF2846)